MNDGLIPNRYAKALYKFAAQSGQQTEVYGQMKSLEAAFASSRELKQVVNNPFVPVAKKQGVLLAAAGAQPGGPLDKFILLGPRGFPQNFSCSAVLRCRLAVTPGFRLRDCHPLRSRFPSCSAILVSSAPSPVLQPRAMRRHIPGLGSCAFARHYLRNHSYFLFLRVLRCFTSPR